MAPDGSEYGADYTVGSCSAALPGAPPPAAGTVKTTAVALSAPKRRVGSGTARVTGRITPARAGVAVKLSAAARQSVTRRTTTGADGSFRFSVPLSETTRLRAVVEGIGSQTLTVTVVSKVRITVKRTRSGAVVTGSVSPALPGRVLWLRTNAVRSSAKTTARSGRFTLRLEHPRRGRYQAVFIPSGNRAERSTSNTGVVR